MSITDKIVPYEVLIRFGEDGLLKGGHYQERRIIELDGERLKHEVGFAKPLGASPEEVKALLPGVALTAFAEIDRLNAIQAGHEQALTDLREQLSSANDGQTRASAEVERLETELAAREATLQVREADIVRIEVQLEEARQALAALEVQMADLAAEPEAA